MKYFEVILVLTIILFWSCESDSEDLESPPLITIVDFKTSKNTVEITWDLEKASNIIIEHLQIVRGSENQTFDNREASKTINIPSSSLSFIDDDVPYLNNLTYTIVASYRLDGEALTDLSISESETLVFSRDFPTFEQVPFQVSQDSDNRAIYHILDTRQGARLLQYNGLSESITKELAITSEQAQNNRFHLMGNTILVATKNGRVQYVNKESYEVSKTIQIAVEEHLDVFAEQNGAIYFLDDGILNYYDLTENLQYNIYFVYGFDSLEALDETTLFAINSHIHVSGALKYEVETTVFPGEDPSTGLKEVANTFDMQNDGNDFDPNILAWSPDGTFFITSIEGRIHRISDFEPMVVLNELTEKRYFSYIFDDKGDIYASVQGEKLIHVFDGNTFELKETIATKLFPFYPLLVNGRLQCIGTYEPLQYWNHIYGYEFSFFKKSAIETFDRVDHIWK